VKPYVWICFLITLLSMPAVREAWAEAYLHPATGMVFQDRVAGMDRGVVTDFEREHPGLGVGIGYNAPGITATIYLYNLGMESVPDSLDSPVLTALFEQAVEDVLQAGRMGMYDSLRKTSETVIGFPAPQSGPRALCASFDVVQQGVERLSKLYLLAYRNHFLKIRFTYDRNVLERAEDTLGQLLEYLAASMKNEAEPYNLAL
jgi:hypothetical protein